MTEHAKVFNSEKLDLQILVYASQNDADEPTLVFRTEWDGMYITTTITGNKDSDLHDAIPSMKVENAEAAMEDIIHRLKS